MADSARVPASEVRSFRDLTLWQEAMDLAVQVHQAARLLPQEQKFELGRDAHVAIALGSTGELETQLEVARRLRLLDERLIESLIERCGTVGRLAQGLWRSLRPPKRSDTLLKPERSRS